MSVDVSRGSKVKGTKEGLKTVTCLIPLFLYWDWPDESLGDNIRILVGMLVFHEWIKDSSYTSLFFFVRHTIPIIPRGCGNSSICSCLFENFSLHEYQLNPGMKSKDFLIKI